MSSQAIAPPPANDVVIPLRISARSRFVALGKGALYYSIAFVTLWRTLTITFSWQRYAAGYDELQARYNFVLLGIALGIIVLIGSYPVLRPALARRASLRFEDGEWLIIDRPGLLRAPIDLPRNDILLAVVDDGSGEGSDAQHRFPVRRTGAEADYSAEETARWLYSIEQGGLLPLLNSTRESPNVALLFRTPLRLPRLKRVVKVFSENSFAFLPARRPQSGLLLSVSDPDVAARAFEEWGSLREPMVTDVRSITPTEEQWRVSRTLIYIRNAIIVALVAGHLLFVFARPAGDACKSLQVFCEVDPTPTP